MLEKNNPEISFGEVVEMYVRLGLKTAEGDAMLKSGGLTS